MDLALDLMMPYVNDYVTKPFRPRERGSTRAPRRYPGDVNGERTRRIPRGRRQRWRPAPPCCSAERRSKAGALGWHAGPEGAFPTYGFCYCETFGPTGDRPALAFPCVMDGSDSSSYSEGSGGEAAIPQRVPSVDARALGLPGARAAFLGGSLAIASSLLIPLHIGGGFGPVKGLGFALAGLVLAGATMAAGAGHPLPHRSRELRYWALLGAMGFIVSGLALLAGLLDRSLLLSEVVAILAVGAWWLVVGGHLVRSHSRSTADGSAAGAGRVLGYVSLACAGIVLVAVAAQLIGHPATGAVPARVAYVLWGPWGLVLSLRLGRARQPL